MGNNQGGLHKRERVLDSQRRSISTTLTSTIPSSGHHALQSQSSTGDDGCPVQVFLF
jgi:hypothetical protein